MRKGLAVWHLNNRPLHGLAHFLQMPFLIFLSSLHCDSFPETGDSPFQAILVGYRILYLPSPIWLIALIKDHLRLSLFDNLDKYFSYNLFVKLSYNLLGHIFYNTPSLLSYCLLCQIYHYLLGQIFCSMHCQMFYYPVKYILGKYFIICSVSIFGDILSPEVFPKTLFSDNLQFSLPSLHLNLIMKFGLKKCAFFPLQEILLFFDGFCVKKL